MAKKKIVIETKYTAKGASNVENAYSGIGDEANKAAESTDKVNESIKETGEAAEGSKGGLSGMLDGFKAIVMNPIGLVLVALVGAIKFVSDALSGSESASNKLSQGFAYLSGFIQPLKDGIVFAFEAIASIISEPGKAWDSMVETFDKGVDYISKNVINPFKAQFGVLVGGIELGILNMRIAWNSFFGDDLEAEALKEELREVEEEMDRNLKVIKDANETIRKDISDSIKSVVGSIGNYIEAADELGDKLSALVKEEQRLVDVRRSQEVQNAKDLADIEKLKVIRDDEAQSLQDRIKANEEIGVIEKRRVQSAILLAEQELAATRENIELRGASTELLDIEAEKLVEIQELRSENAGIENEQVVNNTALRKEQFDKEVQLIEQKRDLEAILEKDAIKLADAVVQAEEDKLLKLRELGLEENQIYRDVQGALALSQQQAIKARLDAEEEADKLKKEAEEERIKLQEKAAAELLIKKKEQDEKDAKDRKDHDDTLLAAKSEFNSGIEGFADSLATVLGENSKIALGIQKAVALRTIAIDTAQAISGLTKASAQNTLNGVTGGAAGAFQFASGLLQIGTNMAKAYSILKAPAPEISGGGSGGGNAPTTQQTSPNLGFEGRSAGSEKFGAQIVRAYVTESDITTSQNTASNIQQLSEIG